ALASCGGADAVREATAQAKPVVNPDGKAAIVPAKPYAILLVLDEFPGDALLDQHGRIDPVRYPNFAALAANSTWYRNAYSLYDSTTRAVPLIMDGIRPAPGPLPSYANTPGSVFSMFGSRGWKVVASQEATSMCAPRYCKGARPQRPPIVPALQA